ncbi:uncharacterized protein LOC144645971 isoform X1 [Oculina patagonica]
MGCIFSRNEALSFRKKKKTAKIDKIHHGHERFSTSLQSVHPVKEPESRPIPSKGAQNNISFIYEGILQEYSTLGFLIGGRNFPDGELVFKERQERKPALQDSIKVPPPQIDTPVSLPAAVSSHEAIREVAAKTIRTTVTTVNLPDCLSYQGIHDNGYHLLWLESATYCRSLESTAHISEAISSVVGGRLFKIVYREHHGGTAYLPHQLAHAGELFDTLCTRFGPQLLLIIFYNPSWYVRTCLEEQRHTRRPELFSFPTMDRIRFIQKPNELAKWTGFPGDVKLPLN